MEFADIHDRNDGDVVEPVDVSSQTKSSVARSFDTRKAHDELAPLLGAVKIDLQASVNDNNHAHVVS